MITKENLIVLLENAGRKLEDCEGECEVETGRRIGVIQREWQRIDPKYLDDDEQRFWATIAGRQIRFDQRADFGLRIARVDRRIGVVEIMRELPCDAQILVVAIGTQPLVPLLQIFLAQPLELRMLRVQGAQISVRAGCL